MEKVCVRVVYPSGVTVLSSCTQAKKVQNPDEFPVNKCYARTGAFRVINETFTFAN